MAQYNPYNVEPARISPPPEYSKIFAFIIRVDGPCKSSWSTTKTGERVIGYNDKSYQLSNPANKNSITENMARSRVITWIEIYDNIVTATIKVPLTRQQRDALIDLLYSSNDVNAFVNSQIVRTLNLQKNYAIIPTLLRQAATTETRQRREFEANIWASGIY
jgi:GH24 family phage-related lysozyme (muramidase)